MNEEHRPDTENFSDEGQIEEFDFGEGESGPEKMRPSSKMPQANRPLLIAIIVLFVILVGYLGYRFFASKKSVSKPEAPVLEAPVISTFQPNEVPAELQTPPQSPGAALPGPTNQTLPGQTLPAPQKGPQTPTDQRQETLSGALQTTPSKEGSIQDLQRELFGTPSTAPGPAGPGSATTSVTVTTASPSDISKALDMLGTLTQQMQININKLKELDDATRTLSQAVGRLDGQINSMDALVSTLSSTTDSLSKDMLKVRGDVGQLRQALGAEGLDLSPAPKKIKVDTTIQTELPEYVVHAVIPGRAWLRSLTGHIITVTEGDKLGDYGKVLVIDATNNVVLTSSGVTFR